MFRVDVCTGEEVDIVDTFHVTLRTSKLTIGRKGALDILFPTDKVRRSFGDLLLCGSFRCLIHSSAGHNSFYCSYPRVALVLTVRLRFLSSLT